MRESGELEKGRLELLRNDLAKKLVGLSSDAPSIAAKGAVIASLAGLSY